MLWGCHDLLIQIFDYYACASGDFGSIGLNQWSEFVEDFEIDDSSSKLCRKADIDTLFIAINATSKAKERERAAKEAAKIGGKSSGGSKDGDKSLDRVEFMLATWVQSIEIF